MAKTSCISYRAGSRFFAVREDYLAITGGHEAAAAVLDVMQHLHESRLHAAHQSRIENAAALTHGLPAVHNEEPWVYLPQPDLRGYLLGRYGEKATADALALCVERGYLSRRVNPRYQWDKTRQYRFNAAAVQAAIDALEPIDAPKAAAPKAAAPKAAEVPASSPQNCGNEPDGNADYQSSPQKCGTESRKSAALLTDLMTEFKDSDSDAPASPVGGGVESGPSQSQSSPAPSKKPADNDYVRRFLAIWHERGLPQRKVTESEAGMLAKFGQAAGPNFDTAVLGFLANPWTTENHHPLKHLVGQGVHRWLKDFATYVPSDVPYSPTGAPPPPRTHYADPSHVPAPPPPPVDYEAVQRVHEGRRALSRPKPHTPLRTILHLAPEGDPAAAAIRARLERDGDPDGWLARERTLRAAAAAQPQAAQAGQGAAQAAQAQAAQAGGVA